MVHRLACLAHSSTSSSITLPDVGPEMIGTGTITLNGTGGGTDCIPVTLKLTTDGSPEETSFFLYDSENVDTEYWNESAFIRSNTEYPEYQACVPRNRCTYFDFFDDGGNGISGPGFTLKADGQVLHTGGDFGSEVYKDIPIGC